MSQKGQFEKEEEECGTIPAMPTVEQTLELLNKFPDVTIYGLLMTYDPKHSLSIFVREHWSELHHLSGPKVLLVAFESPENVSEDLKNYWKEQLGDSFEQIWEEWQKGCDPGLAYDYLDLFQEPKPKPSDLPCLVLFTNLDNPQAVIRSVPNWDTESLSEFFSIIFGAIRECSEQPEEERLKCLQSSLTSPRAIYGIKFTHAGDRTKEISEQMVEKILKYLEENPAKLILTICSFLSMVIAMSVSPLTGLALIFLKEVKDIFSSEK